MADPTLQQFWKKFGYNLVLMPNSGLAPLDLLYNVGSGLEKLGNIDHLFTQNAYQKPSVQKGIPFVELTGVRTDQVNASAVIQLLDGFFQKLGINGGKLTGSLSRMGKIEFLFFFYQSFINL